MNALPPGLPVTYLTHGSHDSPEDGLCLVEAVAHHAACESDREEALLLREIADASLGDPRGRWVVLSLEAGDEAEVDDTP